MDNMLSSLDDVNMHAASESKYTRSSDDDGDTETVDRLKCKDTPTYTPYPVLLIEVKQEIDIDILENVNEHCQSCIANDAMKDESDSTLPFLKKCCNERRI
jgi:hypothetical protein